MPTAPRKTSKPKLSPADKAFHRQAAIAVLGGIYASHGEAILHSTDGERETAMRSAARLAVQQADELVARLAGDPS